MVLVVQPNIVGKEVERAVVREGLWWRRAILGCVLGRGSSVVEDVVLGDEVACAGVERAGEEGGEDEVFHGLPAYELD